MLRSGFFIACFISFFTCFSQSNVEDWIKLFKDGENLDVLYDEYYKEYPDVDWKLFADQSINLIQDDSVQVEFLLTISSFLETRDPKASLSVIDDIESILLGTNNQVWLASVYGEKSYLLTYSGQYKEAVEILSEALGMIDKKENKSIYAELLAHLGRTYNYMEDFASSRKYFEESNELFRALGDEKNLIVNTFNIGGLFMNMEKNDSAILYFEKCIEKAPEYFPIMEAYAYGNIGQVLVNKGDYQAAIESQLKGLKIEEKFEDELSMVDSHGVLGAAYAHLNNRDSSFYHFEKSIAFALKHEVYEKLLDIYESQVESYALLEEYELAFYAGSRLLDLRDSLQTLEVRQIQLDLKEKYETDEKESRNRELSAEVNRQNQLIVGASTLLILAIAVAYYIFRINKKVKFQSEALKEATASKERFFSNITHEFRTPLTLILSPLEKALESPDLSQEKLNQLIRSNHRHASQLLMLVNQLLELNKLESGHMMVKNTVGDFSDFIDQFLIRFRQAAENKSLTFKIINKDVSGFYAFDRAKWERILSNLLGNALKFTEQGDITLEYWNTNEGIGLSVSDTGIGIPNEKLGKIFDRFYQVDGSNTRSYEGTGIGLALVKELVELMEGDIQVSSDSAGTIFSLAIPMESMQNTDVEESLAETIFAQDIAIDDTKALILVVEDNDELRAFLKEQLQEKWNVLEAANGEKAWEIIQEELPDIVVSDVMMPGMNGHELCEKTKAAASTMHINFLMLTAKASKEAVVSGLEMGADDYITKPFHPHELELRIFNMLQQQERLRQHLMQELLPVNIEDVKTTIPHIEDVFLKSMYEYVDSNLNDTTLTADRLAAEMAMSKSTLNRKLRTLLDTTSIDFIRDIRLKRSVEFIKAGHSISETAYSVGFESPSYFTKIFKARYKKTPSEFASELTI
ncbi:hybrid sensor histidine kinase/response regulator transcription factor [Ekhidna sp.]